MGDFQIENGVLVKYTGPGGDVVIPEGTKKIGAYVFYECNTVTSVTIPNGVTSIEDNAFHCCSNLNTITLPDSITYIGFTAFLGCLRLTSFRIPDNVSCIGWDTFYGCSSLTRIFISENAGKFSFWRDFWGLPLEVIQAPGRSLSLFGSDFQKAAAIGYAEMVSEGQVFSDELEAEYLTFIQQYRELLYPSAITYPGLLRYMMLRKIISASDMEILLNLADTQNRPDLKAELLQYIHTAFSDSQPENAFSL